MYLGSQNRILRFAAMLLLAAVLFAALPAAGFAGTQAEPTGGKSGDLRVIYSITCAVSLALFVGYLLCNEAVQKWFALLFLSVFIVNLGYLLMSFAGTLSFALWANRISYFGSALLPLCMLIIVLKSCRFTLSRPLVLWLAAVSLSAFLLAASGGIGTLYYKEVSLCMVNGAMRLCKVYGPLHPLYMVYLLGYFLLMLAAIVLAMRKKKIANAAYAMFLAGVVLMNLLVWGVEQLVRVDFEFLSISYIATELLLLAVFSMVNSLSRAADTVQQLQSGGGLNAIPADVEELFSAFVEKAAHLTASERSIMRYYSEGYEVNEVAEMAFISIHTVRKHNMNMYRKLDVSSREELMLYLELLRRCGRLDEVLDAVPAAQTAES